MSLSLSIYSYEATQNSQLTHVHIFLTSGASRAESRIRQNLSFLNLIPSSLGRLWERDGLLKPFSVTVGISTRRIRTRVECNKKAIWRSFSLCMIDLFQLHVMWMRRKPVSGIWAISTLFSHRIMNKFSIILPRHASTFPRKQKFN